MLFYWHSSKTTDVIVERWIDQLYSLDNGFLINIGHGQPWPF